MAHRVSSVLRLWAIGATLLVRWPIGAKPFRAYGTLGQYRSALKGHWVKPARAQMREVGKAAGTPLTGWFICW